MYQNQWLPVFLVGILLIKCGYTVENTLTFPHYMLTTEYPVTNNSSPRHINFYVETNICMWISFAVLLKISTKVGTSKCPSLVSSISKMSSHLPMEYYSAITKEWCFYDSHTPWLGRDRAADKNTENNLDNVYVLTGSIWTLSLLYFSS